jgi:lactoylglutathione lyase
MRIEHIAIWTTDLERLRAFYVQHFGASTGEKYRNPKTQFESYFVTFADGARLELMTRPDVATNEIPLTAHVIGYAHFALSVGSQAQVDAFTETLRAAGVRIVGEPRTTGDGYYESVVLDPDGNQIEITI